MKLEEAVILVEALLPNDRFNPLQQIVLQQSWQGKTYSEIAELAGYDKRYIKSVGLQLWRLLSQVLDEKVTKSNIRFVLRRIEEETPVVLPLLGVIGSYLENYHYCKAAEHQDVWHALHSPWSEAVEVSVFYGRQSELLTLEQSIVHQHCRLVALIGMGGIGKTTLAVTLAQQIQPHFQHLIWRSLRNAPAIEDTLAELLQVFSHQPLKEVPNNLDTQISQLIHYFRTSPCLLVLDNFESVLQSGDHFGRYREGYEGYGQLLRLISETQHHSCVLLTSREKPIGFALKEGETLPVRSLQLNGLDEASAELILQDMGLFGDTHRRQALINYYLGNPLALKIAATTIQNLFNGQISGFLAEKTGVFGEIRDLIEQQFNRLSSLEKQILQWLAINREPMSITELQADIVPSVSKSNLIDGLISLEQRCFIDKAASHGEDQPSLGRFLQQPVITEYIIERLIEMFFSEIVSESLSSFLQYSLVKPQANSNIKKAQKQIILVPLAEKIQAFFKTKTASEDKLNRLYWKLSNEQYDSSGYGLRNLIELCRYLKVKLK